MFLSTTTIVTRHNCNICHKIKSNVNTKRRDSYFIIFQYDSSSYSRSRDTSRGATSSSNDRPTSVTAKYINTTPSYKSSNIPVLNSAPKDESPISAIASRYSNYGKSEKTSQKYDSYGKSDKTPSKYDSYSKLDKNTSKYDSFGKADKPSTKYESPKYDAKYEKKDYSKLNIPSACGKSRDVSPVSTTSKYSYNRPSRHLSPERRTKSFNNKSRDPSPADRDKDIPSKTDKSSGYNSLSSYKLYPRTSNYARPASRAETKPEISINRYSVSNRLSSNYLRSPPTVKRTSVSPVNNHSDTSKTENDMSVSPIVIVEEADQMEKEQEKVNLVENGIKENGPLDNRQEETEIETETVTVITRHTSPTPPGSSAYVRSRRADMAKTIEKSVTRSKKRPVTSDKEVQSDRLDDPTRSSRFAGTTRASVSNWSYYSPNSYTGYAGRYSTQYSNLRENSQTYSDRSSRSRSKEPHPVENNHSNSLSENSICVNDKSLSNNTISDTNKEIVAVFEQNKNDDMPEIIINVNLKLKRGTSPMVPSSELVSPEVTITNSQLPPQAPKSEGSAKPKKIKVRKSSTDSSDSGSKKKVVKKRSKSVSSTDSDQGSEAGDKNKSQSVSPPKSINKTSSGNILPNGLSKIKHSKSRESNSPESSITLSTQSSISEDEPMSKSKTNDRTSADENSLPTDRSMKQSSPQKNDTGTEEAKSFLIRALAPVTNLFKIRHQESTENSRWPENSSSESTGKDVSNLITESDKTSKSKNIIASNDDNLVKLKSIKPIESGERAWWLDSESEKKISENFSTSSDKNVPRKIKHIESGERAWWLDSNSESKTENQLMNKNVQNENSDSSRGIKKSKFVDEEKPWWLDSCANIPEGVERLTPPRKSSSDSEKSDKFNFFKVRHIESGDQKDWWATSNENSSHTTNKSDVQNSLSKSGSDQKSFPLKRIRHVESGERPWWLSSDKNIPEGIEKLPTPPPQPESDSSDSEEVQVYVPPSHIPPFPLHLPDDEPLGARRSPEGLETPKDNEDYRGRTSPYENNRQYRRRSLYQKGMDRYISRYTDIDDILGTSGHIYSPFMDSILARRTGQITFDDDECEEIDPTQVRIHDSTAQRPVIKKIRGR